MKKDKVKDAQALELLRPLSDRQLRELAKMYAVSNLGHDWRKDSMESLSENYETYNMILEEAKDWLKDLMKATKGKKPWGWAMSDLKEMVEKVRNQYPEDATDLPVKLSEGEKLSTQARKIVKKEVKSTRLAHLRAKAKVPEKKEPGTRSMKSELLDTRGELKWIKLYGKEHEVEVLAVKGSVLWYKWPESDSKKVHRTQVDNLVQTAKR